MMGSLLTMLQNFFNGIKLWITVAPWEQGIRVRAGKHLKFLGAGIHFKLPVLDNFYIQTTRLRLSGTGRQTTTTKDGKTITFAAAVGYQIDDLVALYKSLHHAEDTIQNLIRGALSDYVSTHVLEECTPGILGELIREEVLPALRSFGLGNVNVYLMEFSVVKTYRLIGDYGAFGGGSGLDTTQKATGGGTL
jgi:SPFH domain/Band 7 family protein